MSISYCSRPCSILTNTHSRSWTEDTHREADTKCRSSEVGANESLLLSRRGDNSVMRSRFNPEQFYVSKVPDYPEDLFCSMVLDVVNFRFPKKLGSDSGSSFIPVSNLIITPVVEVTWMPLQPKEAANTLCLYDLAPADFSKPVFFICFSSSSGPIPKHQLPLPNSPCPLMPLRLVVLQLECPSHCLLLLLKVCSSSKP